MASYRQLPEALRRLHPRFKTPWLSLVLFAGIAPILVILPGNVKFVGTLYSLGATLSFTVAHASIVRLRMVDGDEADIPYRARPNLRIGSVAWPLFALLGGIATGISFLVLVAQNPLTRWVGLGWMVFGLVGYVVYRRRWVHAPVREITKAPPAFGPALALEYRRLLVPVIQGPPSDAAMDVACRLAAERGSRIVALNVLEIPSRPHAGRARRSLRGRRRAARVRAPEASGGPPRDSSATLRAARTGTLRGPGDRHGSRGARCGDHRAGLSAPRPLGPTSGRAREDRRFRPQARALQGHGDGWRRSMRMYRAAVVFRARLRGDRNRLLVRTAAEGGGVVGFVLGGLFILLGVGRSIERSAVARRSAASSASSTPRPLPSRTARSPRRSSSRSASSRSRRSA
jgi:hypothetical protein